jgi:hypothetical protein
MDENRIEDIKNSVRQLLQLFVQKGQPLSNDLKLELMKVLQHAEGRIAEFRKQSLIQTTIQSPVPEGVDLLWILSGKQPNAFVSYLRTFPGEGFNELANNPSRLASIIENLERNDPFQEAGIGSDGIPNTELMSSNVIGMKYSPKNGSLLVKFFGNGKPDPVYQYDGVPVQIFKLLEHGNAFAKTKGSNSRGSWWPMKNPSIGASVNEYLKKGGYSYKRLK